MQMSLVEPELLSLFIKEPIYVLPQDRPQISNRGPESIPAKNLVHFTTSEKPVSLAAAEKAPTKSTLALPAILPKSLVVLVHQLDGKLSLDQELMLGKLALATEPDATFHHLIIGDMSAYSWPNAWNPWPARLTLLLGWPDGLLAKHRVSGHFQILKFGATKVLAGPHTGQLEADKSLKAQLWAAIQAAR